MSAEDDKDKAAALQEFFLSPVYTTETEDAPERLLYRIDDNSMRSYDFVITQEDICTRLAKLKIDKSPAQPKNFV